MDAKPELIRDGFKDLKLSSWLIDQCLDNGIKHPTSVQYHCIPKILQGEDCISVSQTGTGKTIAFALPIIQKLSEDPHGYFALILSPTRELALQISEQFRFIGKPLNTQVLELIGGVDMMYQSLRLNSQPHIIVATPGRLADHLDSCANFSLRTVQFLVLDEADRLLEGQYDHQLQPIFNALPSRRQTLMFSATPIENMPEKPVCSPNAFVWSADKCRTTVEKLDHRFILAIPHMKEAYLAHIVQEFQLKYSSSSIIVFTNSCRFCQILSSALNAVELKNVALHSGLSQKQRKAALSQFKSKTVKLLIATDLVGRGLDIPAVDLVVNHNVPKNPTDYIHRVGRTARAGRKGIAVTLVTRKDVKFVRDIEKQIKKKLEEYFKDPASARKSTARVKAIFLQVNVAMKEAAVNLDFDKDDGRLNTNEEKL